MTEREGPILRDGTKVIATVPPGESVVGMTNFNGRIIVAMTCGVYYIEQDTLLPLKFEDPE